MKCAIVESSVVVAALILVPLCLGAAEPAKTEVDGRWEATRYVDKGKDDAEVVKAKFVVVRDKGTQTIWKEGKVWKDASIRSTPRPRPRK